VAYTWQSSQHSIYKKIVGPTCHTLSSLSLTHSLSLFLSLAAQSHGSAAAARDAAAVTAGDEELGAASPLHLGGMRADGARRGFPLPSRTELGAGCDPTASPSLPSPARHAEQQLARAVPALHGGSSSRRLAELNDYATAWAHGATRLPTMTRPSQSTPPPAASPPTRATPLPPPPRASPARRMRRMTGSTRTTRGGPAASSATMASTTASTRSTASQPRRPRAVAISSRAPPTPRASSVAPANRLAATAASPPPSPRSPPLPPRSPPPPHPAAAAPYPPPTAMCLSETEREERERGRVTDRNSGIGV
jgi:hypothetical protein